MSILGTRVLRKEDPRFLRGEGRYVENLELEGALTLAFVRSPVAHARVAGVDAAAAAALPGVQVLTAADVDLPPLESPFPGIDKRMARPFVAGDTVRFAGDILALVLAEDRTAAADAAELVVLDLDPLPAVVAPEEAAADRVLLFPDAGTNVAAGIDPPQADPDLFDGCEVVVSGTTTSQRVAPCPLEPRSAAAAVGPDGRLTAWLSTQTPHFDRLGLAGNLGLDPAQVRVVAPDVGGGFGAKGLGVEEILVAWLARRLGRPVRWTETRSESMVALVHGRAQTAHFTLGGTRDGTLLAYRLELLQDAGAYPGLGAILPGLTALMSSGAYAIPRIEVEARSVVTNTTPIGAFRGAGRPEAAQAIERAVDRFAAEAGLDPAEVRRRNFVGGFPHTTASHATYDSGDYAGAFERALDAAGYEALRAEQRARRADGGTRLLGIGIGSYVEVTNGTSDDEFGDVEITPSGGAVVRTGSFSHGQGHETTFAMIAADRLGVPLEDVTVVKGDTDEVERGTGTYGSKSTQIGGTAAALASEQVVERAKALAGELLEAAAADVVLDRAAGRFHIAGAPGRGMTWAELAGRAAAEDRLGELKAADSFKGAPTFSFGTHVAVVEVDAETGEVELRRLVAVDDAGTIVNPLIVEGQVHGGLATGAAQALYEQVVYDEHGNPLTGSFAGYGFPSAAELPSWEVHHQETPTPLNPLGAKGIGESGTIGATPAVHNAVVDALAPLGVRHVDLPAYGENVWRAIRDAATG